MLTTELLYPVMLLLNIGVGTLLLYFFWGKKDTSSTLWALSSFLLVTGIIIVLLGSIIHPFLRFALGNACTMFAIFLSLHSIYNLFGERFSRIWISALISLLFGFGVFVLVALERLVLLPVYVGLANSVVQLCLAYFLIRLNAERANAYLKLFTIAFFLGSLVWFARAVLSQLFDFVFALDADRMSWFTMLGIALLVLLRHVIYLMMRFGRTQEEKEVIQKLNTTLQQTVEKNKVLIDALATAVKANQMGGAVAGIVHELTQPLAAIAIHTESLINSAGQPNDAKWQYETLTYIHQDNARARNIIMRLRDFYKKGTETFSIIELDQLIRNVMHLVQYRFSEEHVVLKPNIASNVCVMGDKNQLEMVILNLLTNALNALTEVKFAPQVQLQLQIEHEEAVLYVTDNGYGIAPDQHQSIFNLFHTTTVEGMGVGLWLSRTIMESHKGRLELIGSDAAQTCFRLSMPLYKESSDVR